MAADITLTQELVNLKGKVAIVTGAAQGLGYAIALRLVEAGAAVALLDIQEELLKEKVDTLTAEGHSVAGFHCDVADGSSVNSAFAATLENLGGLDVLVNNAGFASNVAWELMDDREFRRVTEVHIDGSFRSIRSAIEPMRERGGGSIINITSTAAYRPGAPGMAHYAASKNALWGLTKAAAVELGPFGIRSNAIAPGSTFTEGLQKYVEEGAPMAPQGQDAEKQFEEVRTRTPLLRMCVPDDIARVAIFLASDLSAFVNGAQIPVDGGFLLRA
jgi:NAD(P)-dependent dehydrogenase (short-subunit alcohol dehydrogenase family)